MVSGGERKLRFLLRMNAPETEKFNFKGFSDRWKPMESLFKEYSADPKIVRMYDRDMVLAVFNEAIERYLASVDGWRNCKRCVSADTIAGVAVSLFAAGIFFLSHFLPFESYWKVGVFVVPAAFFSTILFDIYKVFFRDDQFVGKKGAARISVRTRLSVKSSSLIANIRIVQRGHRGPRETKRYERYVGDLFSDKGRFMYENFFRDLSKLISR